MPEKSAWITIWTKPRETIRRILSDHPKEGLWRLASLYGFVSLLSTFQSFSIGAQVGPWAILIFSIIFAPLWGYLLFGIWTGIMLWVGKLFRGNGDFQGLRAAYAWSCVPLIVNALIWILMIYLFGAFIFTSGGTAFHSFPTGMGILLSLLLLMKVIMSIWSLVIYLNTVAEVQQFSVLRAIGNVIIAGVVLGIGLGILVFFALYFVGLGAQEAGVATSTIFQIFGGKFVYSQSI